jgi:ribose 1,5-bisphosphokinase PhnN
MRNALAIAVVLLVSFTPAPVMAEDGGGCLTRAEQKAAIVGGQAVTLATAIRAARLSVRGRGAREVVKARLCRSPEGLRYVLTVLARDGKVTQATIDARSGKLVEAR